MTRAEAEKKAQELAATTGGDFVSRAKHREGCVNAFMACYDWMTSGEPDGWVVQHKVDEALILSTFNSESRDALARWGKDWRVVPVRLIICEENDGKA